MNWCREPVLSNTRAFKSQIMDKGPLEKRRARFLKTLSESIEDVHDRLLFHSIRRGSGEGTSNGNMRIAQGFTLQEKEDRG
jgi:hypothetical protein